MHTCDDRDNNGHVFRRSFYRRDLFVCACSIAVIYFIVAILIIGFYGYKDMFGCTFSIPNYKSFQNFRESKHLKFDQIYMVD